MVQLRGEEHAAAEDDAEAVQPGQPGRAHRSVQQVNIFSKSKLNLHVVTTVMLHKLCF